MATTSANLIPRSSEMEGPIQQPPVPSKAEVGQLVDELRNKWMRENPQHLLPSKLRKNKSKKLNVKGENRVPNKLSFDITSTLTSSIEPTDNLLFLIPQIVDKFNRNKWFTYKEIEQVTYDVQPTLNDIMVLHNHCKNLMVPIQELEPMRPEKFMKTNSIHLNRWKDTTERAANGIDFIPVRVGDEVDVFTHLALDFIHTNDWVRAFQATALRYGCIIRNQTGMYWHFAVNTPVEPSIQTRTMLTLLAIESFRLGTAISPLYHVDFDQLIRQVTKQEAVSLHQRMQEVEKNVNNKVVFWPLEFQRNPHLETTYTIKLYQISIRNAIANMFRKPSITIDLSIHTLQDMAQSYWYRKSKVWSTTISNCYCTRHIPFCLSQNLQQVEIGNCVHVPVRIHSANSTGKMMDKASEYYNRMVNRAVTPVMDEVETQSKGVIDELASFIREKFGKAFEQIMAPIRTVFATICDFIKPLINMVSSMHDRIVDMMQIMLDKLHLYNVSARDTLSPTNILVVLISYIIFNKCSNKLIKIIVIAFIMKRFKLHLVLKNLWREICSYFIGEPKDDTPYEDAVFGTLSKDAEQELRKFAKWAKKNKQDAQKPPSKPDTDDITENDIFEDAQFQTPSYVTADIHADASDIDNNLVVDAETTAGSTSFLSLILDSMPDDIPSILSKIIVVAICGMGVCVAIPSVRETTASKICGALRNMHFMSAGIFAAQKLVAFFSEVIPNAISTLLGAVGIGKGAAATKKKEDEECWIKFKTDLADVVSFSTILSHQGAIAMIRRSIDLQILVKKYYVIAEHLKHQSLRQPIVDLLKPQHRVELLNSMKNLVTLRNVVYRVQAHGGFRYTPFHIQFTGEPGVGKTSIISLLTEYIRGSCYPDHVAANMIWSKGESKHFDGYTGQPIMIIDDANAFNDYETVAIMLNLISSAPVVLPMADLVDKGMFFSSEWIISTTNTAYPDIDKVFNNQAFHRRRHMLCHVNCDPDVYCKTQGRFDMKLFEKKYGIMSSETFKETLPHLTFDLCKPVTDSPHTTNVMTGRLTKAEASRMDGVRYEDDDEIPEGFSRPLTGLTITELKQRIIIAKIAMNDSEKKLFNTDPEAFKKEQEKVWEAIHLFNDNYPCPVLQQILDTRKIPVNMQEELDELLDESEEDLKQANEIIMNSFYSCMDDIRNQYVTNTTMITTPADIDRAARQAKYEKDRRERILKKMNKQEPTVELDPFFGTVGEQLDGEPYFRISDVRFVTVDIPIRGLKSYFGRHKIRITNDMLQFPCVSNELATNFVPVEKLSQAFLSSLVKVGHHWHTKFSDYHLFVERSYCCDEMREHNAAATGSGSDIRPITIEEFLGASPHFREQVDVFLSAPPTLQQMLVDRANANFLYVNLSRQFRTNYTEVAKNVLHRFFDELHETVYHVIYNLRVFIVFGLIGFYVGVITGAASTMASLVVPEAHTTSRTFFSKQSHHKANTTSSDPQVVHQAVPTSQLFDDMSAKAKRNMYIMQRDTFPLAAMFNGIGHDHFIICPWHAVEDLQDGEELLIANASNTDFTPIRYKINKADLHHIPNSDVAIIYSRFFPAASHIAHLFITEEDILTGIGNTATTYFVTKDNKIEPRYKEKDFNIYLNPVLIQDEFKVIHKYKMCKLSGTTSRGSSGGVVYYKGKDNRNFIGIQSYSSKLENCSWVSNITQEDIQKITDKYKKINFTHEEPIGVQEAHTTSLVGNNLVHIGDVSPNMATGFATKTLFVESPVADEFPTERGPAIISQSDKRLKEGEYPLEYSINKSGRDTMVPLDQDILDSCVQEIAIDLKGKIGASPLRSLTISEAVTGLREPGFSPMNLKTSPGLPWVKMSKKAPGKKTWLQIDDRGFLDFISNDLTLEVENFEAKMRQGIIPSSIMYEFPKDELRPIYKITNPVKTRSISVLNFVHAIIYRQYTLDFEARMHRLADGESVMCVGINPEGMDWTNMYHSLLKIGSYGCDFDVGNWDGHMTAQLFIAATEVINILYNDDNSIIRLAIADHAIFGHFQIGRHVVRKSRGMPSGFPGTAIVNTLTHYILLYYIYKILAQELWPERASLMGFYQNLGVRIYGDDVICVISDESLRRGFTPDRIINFYRKHGWPITSASKDTDPSQLKPVLELQFLKRHFRADDIMGEAWIHAAIDVSVINDLCHWYRKGENNPSQFQENLLNAAEFMFAHGKQAYDLFISKLNKALIKNRCATFPIVYSTMRRIMLNRLYV